jgi:Ran GTPase-activating protein (RanGAP) involved in mRNA processing and transport
MGRTTHKDRNNGMGKWGATEFAMRNTECGIKKSIRKSPNTLINPLICVISKFRNTSKKVKGSFWESTENNALNVVKWSQKLLITLN